MEPTPPFDVIIVGAGPAGAAAAYFLGEAGQRVVVLEKNTVPRYKACGGGLSARMLEKWFPFSFEPVVETRPRSITYSFGSHTVTLPVTDRSMRLVMRDRFDAYLLAHAQAEVRPGAAVQTVCETPAGVRVETADGALIEGRYLIGADGANSVVARSVGLRRSKTLVAAIEAEAYVPPEVWSRFADGPWFIVGELKLGYLWIFPKSDHLSVGIGALHPKAGELQAVLARVMARYGISLAGVPLHGHPIPIYIRHEPLATARTLLVGDAAGLVDPFSGEGIRLAIKSGRLAAQAILANQPEKYTATIQHQIGLSHMLGWAVTWLFFHFQPLGFALFVPNPVVTQACVDMLSDQTSYWETILRSLGTLPISLLARAINRLTALFASRQHPSAPSSSDSHLAPPPGSPATG